MNLLMFLTLFLLSNLILSDDEIKTLCEDPVIEAADRLSNNTVRVYRGDYYWELKGLPDIPTVPIGPTKVWYRNMLPIDMGIAITTVVNKRSSSHSKDMTYKFKNKRWWRWNTKGNQEGGGVNGDDSWSNFPDEGGFQTAFNDGNMLQNKTYSSMIAFRPLRVYYYNTDNWPVSFVGDRKGYPLKGKYNENFPSDLTAAFAYPLFNSSIYSVYLFKHEKFCFRPIFGNNSQTECKSLWRDNKELFGCYTTSPNTPQEPETSPTLKQNENTVPPSRPPQTTEQESGNFALLTTNQNMKVNLILVTFSLLFFNLIY